MSALTIRPYERQHQEAVLDLLFYARRTHTHLDWYRVSNWLDLPDIRVVTAWDDQQLLGVMGLSSLLNRSGWIRLLAVDNTPDPQPILSALWESLRQSLQGVAVDTVGILVINRWLSLYLGHLGFHYEQDVVTLSRVGVEVPSLPAYPYVVQNAYLDALADMAHVDHAAFEPPWQMTRDEIRQAQRQSATCTVALVDDKIVGYQVATRHQNVAHLARLAVLPAYQGKGVGATLLHHLTLGLIKRSVRAITVNTQQNNIRSQQLYLRYGFRPNGYDLPVWMMYF